MKRLKRVLVLFLCLLMLYPSAVNVVAEEGTVSGNDVVNSVVADTAVGACTECGILDGHTESCLQLDVSVNEIQTVDESSMLTSEDLFSDWEEVNQIGYFADETVMLYSNPEVVIDDSITLTKGVDMPESFTVQYKLPLVDASGNTVYWYMLDTENWAHEGWNTDNSIYGYVQAVDVTFDVPEGEPEYTEISGVLGECSIKVSGNIPNNVIVSVQDVEINASDFGIDDTDDIISSFDLKLMDGNTEWQPTNGETVTITLDATALGMSDGDEFTIYHQHGETITVSDVYVVENGLLTFTSDGFSIYVVVGAYENNWNYNNYQITMTVGDSLTVSTSTAGNSYAWSIIDGDMDSFSLTNPNEQQATITAKASGTIKLQCVITPRRGTGSTTENLQVVALPSVGNSVDDDIIFANIDKAYTSGDTEYENTYGPYVMKIRFEDTDGNILKYDDGTTVGEDYYVFDSQTNIDVNTFAASAPDGYTYAGAFFYWSGHFSGDKVYVTNVDRDNSSTAYGSHLWYSGTHSTSGAGRWAYQSSGVLHVVYAPIEDVYTVIFKDHCGYELANYALEHNDSGVTFPSGYVDNISNTANTLIPTHHTAHDSGYDFNDSWVVTGGGEIIDGTYTTDQLKTAIKSWNITSNITITAQCSEPEVTINYMVVGPAGCGSVTPTSETVKVTSEDAKGSTATPAENYKFIGWFSDADCTNQISTDIKYVPQKVDGKNVTATYYAKFELAVADLTITKTGIEIIDENQSVIFSVEGMGMKLNVVINGNGSVTIKDLPLGEYTITENTGWSWRYDTVNENGEKINNVQNVTISNEDENVTFINKRTDNQWLDSNSYKENIFKKIFSTVVTQ